MELITLGAFVVMLMGCIVAGIPTIFALLAGLVLFCVYALVKGNTLGAVALMCWHGIKPICGILGMLLFIGMLTGVWRAAGVIPAIVYYAVPFITPSLFVVMTFLLNALVSVLTGTSFGTAATMGAICISLAGTMNVPLPVAGGAALSGAFFGDRWSPISTSALLVADITGTDFYANLKRMLRSAAVPFVLTCAVFLALGVLMPRGFGQCRHRRCYGGGVRPQPHRARSSCGGVCARPFARQHPERHRGGHRRCGSVLHSPARNERRRGGKHAHRGLCGAAAGARGALGRRRGLHGIIGGNRVHYLRLRGHLRRNRPA